MTRAFSPGVPPLAAMAAQALGWTPEALGPTSPVGDGVDRSDLDSLMEQYPDA